MAGQIVDFDHIAKRFYKKGRAVQALEDVSFSIAPGEFVAVVGPSGCGKSTLLNMTAGLMAPSPGQVRYRGEPVVKVNTAVGYVTQRDNLLPWRTVRDNIGIALELHGVKGQKKQDLIRDVIEKVGLSGFEEHYPNELSGGMRKRVTLARTLIYDPETLLMDEPFGALDAQLKLILQDELLRIWDSARKTIIFVTHDLSEAVALADRVVVLTARPAQVKIIQQIDLPRPRDAFAVRFLPRFAELNHELWEVMKDDVKKGTEV